MPRSWPTDEQGRSLHRRLCDREASAPSDFAVAYADPLGAWLQAKNRGADEDQCQDAAHRALLALIHHPDSYNADHSELASYLRMSAQGDLLNLLRREGRHHRRRLSWETVEHASDAGKYRGRADDPAWAAAHDEEARRRAAILAAVREALSESDRVVFDLMQTGERQTAVFAAAMGLSDRPRQEQEREAKRAKDRIKKRVERAGGAP
jgi:RNA polymerase sigma factor (sigma-70 family)